MTTPPNRLVVLGMAPLLDGLEYPVDHWVPGSIPDPLIDATIMLAQCDENLEARVASAREHTNAPLVVLASTTDREVLHRAAALGAIDVVECPDNRPDVDRLEFSIERATSILPTRPISTSHLTHAHVITVLAPKGGTGATTVAANLAVSAAEGLAIDTLLLDFVLAGGDAATLLGMPLDRTLLNAIMSQGDLDIDKVRGFALRHQSGADVIPAPISPQDAALIAPDRLLDLLEAAGSGYQLIVVDAHIWSGDMLLAALDATDTLLVITTPDIASLKATQQAFRYLDEISFPRDRRHVVLNRYSRKSRMSNSEIERVLGESISWSIREDAAVRDYGNRGLSIVTASKRSPAARDINALGVAVTNNSPTARHGLLHRNHSEPTQSLRGAD